MMKRTFLFFLSVMMAIVMTAGDVTPEQALQQAQNFLLQSPSGMKRSQAEVSQLKMAGRVSGLYVFNAEGNQGFVIVSNDDRTVPVLGYSETGNLDPDNMPCNMRAWLQGYADEIAWLNENNVQLTGVTVPHRASAVKEPIAPLVKTHWNQEAPYNDNCPEYTTGKKSVTGCIATAMAQVMNYHQFANMTAEIPGYTTTSYSIPIAALSPVDFDWANMQLDYVGGETPEQNAAVAQLMQYCGASVQMNYGNPSLAYDADVPNALIKYFGYNATTKIVIRSLYSYAEWIEIIYHELKQGRPMVYNGQASDNGHAFVCDGYQGEDYFHINWGWGGLSDNYFKLSALDSNQQGIGGSSSNAGYYYGQTAIIGIQKPDDTGTVLDIAPHAIKLTCSSISCVDEAAVGQEVDITLTITNNADQDYSGDIYVGTLSYGLFAGSLFEIPAKGTKDCALKATFNNAGTYDLVFFFPAKDGLYYTNGETSKTITITAGGGGGLPTSDNVDLTASVKSIENANADMAEVYGNANNKDINAVITINNPSTECNYYGKFYVRLRPVGNSGSYYNWGYIRIPAGGSYDFVFTAQNYTLLNSNYHFTVQYQKNGSGSSEENIGNAFSFLPGIFAYHADGTKTATKAAGPVYGAPDKTLAVDMSGTGITTVVSAEPNCLFIIGDGDPAPIGSGNIVAKSGSSYIADNIILTDGNDFYSPVDFTAKNIEFTYDNDRWADGTKGWNTIFLPYDVKSVTAAGTTIDWFHSGSDTGKQFWMKQFVSDDPGVVNFNFTDEMKANTPYIIALPGDHWGTDYNLSGKTIKFIGQDVTVHKSVPGSVTGGNYRFIGDTKAVDTENIYCLNAAGNKFVLNNGGAPFRAYFKPGIFDSTVTGLSINNSDETTGISDATRLTNNEQIINNIWYDLQGRRVENPTKGVYIQNGKLFIKK